jgi:hypothetical protein
MKKRENHGMRHTTEYRSWTSTLTRCTNPRHEYYNRYGGRGITICDRWRDSFQAFYADMGPKPGPEYTIERENNDGNYEPGNCKWDTRKNQARNRSTNHLIQHDGQMKTSIELGELVGVSRQAMVQRQRYGYNNEQLTKPPRTPTLYAFDDKNMSLHDWGVYLGSNYYALHNRIYVLKWPLARVFSTLENRTAYKAMREYCLQQAEITASC